MRLKVAKNGKEYRCDVCQVLIRGDDVKFFRESGLKEAHLCSWRHHLVYIRDHYNLPLFPATNEQMTGNVIPVKNGATSQ